MSTSGKNPSSEVIQYLEDLPKKNVEPLWKVMSAMVPPMPAPKAEAAMWKYEEIKPLLLEAGRLVAADEAERRVLMLVNPSMRAPYSTDTIYAGLQLILPGETAPAHRHTAFALRFIIEGDKGFTTVGGKKIVMRRGDVILTPSWEWHDHGHEGEGPMIWLDGLDLPLYQSFPTNFAELYEQPRYPCEETPEISDLRFSWDDVQKVLDAQSGSHAIYQYRNRNGRQLSLTMGGQAERIDAGSQSQPIRESCSFVYHCFQGLGQSILQLADSTNKTLTWQQGDTFTVPAWTGRSHLAAERSYLFAITDSPLLEGLGMYRKE